MRKVIGKEIGDTTANGGPELVQASYYFRYYLARALDHAGMADGYLKALGSWHEFLKMGFTTWPEQPGDTRSDSHAWTAHPTFDLLTLVAGIAPGSPGFQTVRIAPHLGDLTSVEASYPHEGGLIHVKYELGASGLKAVVELPSGLSGSFVWRGKETPLHSGSNSFNVK
jgi:alpha-L-rhamnosidase